MRCKKIRRTLRINRKVRFDVFYSGVFYLGKAVSKANWRGLELRNFVKICTIRRHSFGIKLFGRENYAFEKEVILPKRQEIKPTVCTMGCFVG